MSNRGSLKESDFLIGRGLVSLSLAILSSQFIIDKLEDRIIIYNLTNTLISVLRLSANKEVIGLSLMACTPKILNYICKPISFDNL